MRLNGVAVPFMVDLVRDVAIGVRRLLSRCIRIL